MPRALVTGATGLLGRAIHSAFTGAGYETTGTGFSRASGSILRLDIQDEAAVQKVFDEVIPDVVIHSAADRSPDSCTRDPIAARRLNVSATETLARVASQSKNKTLVIYISTDYVFSGAQGEAPYKTDAATGPTNIYGQTKLEGETAVLQYPGTVVLRVPVLYGATEPRENNAESAVNVLLDALWKSQKENVKMDDWAIRYPTNVIDVARVLVDITEKARSSPGDGQDTLQIPRVLHFSSEDRMTKYEIVKILADIMDLPVDGVIPDRDGGKPGPDGTLRPFDCHLDTATLKELGISVDTVNFVAWWRRWVGAFRH
ncbi:dTDP-4-dehydrorhamnose reductase [Exophiala mesophila]|uniref:dTDP-4-dehydrorhamnose reductase n=1 Tax=Exophiala mesophila TaxID=212818 RepID=A0A0D1ZFT6_EXOME|nr:dTDP-4-dehydrorhamnose reductase [Exophiala mesophila]KIV92734.1 dTDP-4-dehydrorhamnose reductase [Exophiala mesophila]